MRMPFKPKVNEFYFGVFSPHLSVGLGLLQILITCYEYLLAAHQV